MHKFTPLQVVALLLVLAFCGARWLEQPTGSLLGQDLLFLLLLAIAFGLYFIFFPGSDDDE